MDRPYVRLFNAQVVEQLKDAAIGKRPREVADLIVEMEYRKGLVAFYQPLVEMAKALLAR